MPLESLQTLQDLDITGPVGSEQDETQHEPVEGDQGPARTFHPAPAPQPPSQPHPFHQPHSSPFYPQLLSSFGFDSDSILPIDQGLLDARFDHPAASGPGGGVAGFQQSPWTPQSATSANMDSLMVSPTSLTRYNSSMSLVPGMSSFEPMVSTAWSMDSSLTSTSESGGPTWSSSMSVHGTPTPASSQSPSSPRKASSIKLGPRAVSKEALPDQSGMRVESRAQDQPNKKRRQSSGLRAPPKTGSEKRSHRNNSSPGLTTPQVPIAPAPIAAAKTSDGEKQNDNKNSNNRNNDRNNNISSNAQQQQQPKTATTTTTSTPPSQPSSSTQPPPQQADHRARNREAANRCRAKGKVAVAELEATERAMSTEHEALARTVRSLRDEVLALKNQLLMHGNCDDDVIQQYLANSARMVGSGAAAMLGPAVTTAGPVIRRPVLAGPPGVGGGSSSRAVLSASPPGVPPHSPVSGAGTTAGSGRQRDGRPKH